MPVDPASLYDETPRENSDSNECERPDRSRRRLDTPRRSHILHRAILKIDQSTTIIDDGLAAAMHDSFRQRERFHQTVRISGSVLNDSRFAVAPVRDLFLNRMYL